MADGTDFKTSSALGRNLDGEAERQIVSALLAGGKAAVDEAIEANLSESDFANERLGTIWSALVEMADADRHIDLLGVVDLLLTSGRLDAVGGSSAVAQLHAMMIGPHRIAERARMVMANASYRRLAEASQIIHKAALDRDSTAVELMAEAQEAFLHLNERASSSAEVVDIRQSVTRVLESAGKPAPGAVPTGFAGLDVLLRGGLRPAHLNLVAGRPGQGKTALALAIADHVAGEVGIPVGFISLEMAADELVERLISSRSGVTPRDWGRQRSKVAQAAGVVHDLPIHIVDKPGLSISEICAMGRRMKARQGIGLFIVDHIGKVRPSDRYAGSPVHEIGEISESLRALAGTLSIPVVALSQLNRAVESRTEKRPGLGDLRDSGTLEQDANVVIFPFRPEYYMKEKTPENLRGLCQIDVAKNRAGALGTVDVNFDAPTQRFSERDPRD